jgi:hypothetical protein
MSSRILRPEMGPPSNQALSIAALLGAAWCLVLSPIQSADSHPGMLASKPAIVVVFAPLVDVGEWVYEAIGRWLGTPYEFWGRLFAPVYLATAAGLVVLRRVIERPGLVRAATIAIGALVVGAIVDAGAYWSHGTPLQPILWSGGFAVELLALGVVLLAEAALGIGLLRGRHWPEGGVLLLGLAAVPLTMMLVDYMPHGAMLALAFSAAVVGVIAARRPDAGAWARGRSAFGHPSA